MNLVEKVERKYMDREISEFRSGDTVRVNVKIQEGDKSRIQVFEGVVIAIKRNGLSSTFTVRKVSVGYGVERIFPFYSPTIQTIEVVKRGRVRRANSTICGSARVKRLGSKNEGGDQQSPVCHLCSLLP